MLSPVRERWSCRWVLGLGLGLGLELKPGLGDLRWAGLQFKCAHKLFHKSGIYVVVSIT